MGKGGSVGSSANGKKGRAKKEKQHFFLALLIWPVTSAASELPRKGLEYLNPPQDNSPTQPTIMHENKAEVNVSLCGFLNSYRITVAV